MSRTRRPQEITQNGRAVAVVLTPEDGALSYPAGLRAEIDESLASAERGTVSLDDVIARARGRIAAVTKRRGAAG